MTGPSSSGQDTSLSNWRHGFNPRRPHHGGLVRTTAFQVVNRSSILLPPTKEIIMKWKGYKIDIQNELPPHNKWKAFVCKIKGHDLEERSRTRFAGNPRIHRCLSCLRCGYEVTGILRG